MARMARLFSSQLDGGTMPDVVAKAVLDAINTESPQLRYLVGEDAIATAYRRDRISTCRGALRHLMKQQLPSS